MLCNLGFMHYRMHSWRVVGHYKKGIQESLICVFHACFGIVGNSTHPSSRYFHQLLPISFGYIQLKRAWEIGEKIV